MEFTLMNKNTEVLDFLYDDETHNIDKITNLIHPEYAPLGIIDYKIGIGGEIVPFLLQEVSSKKFLKN